jgi:hypothetical protein
MVVMVPWGNFEGYTSTIGPAINCCSAESIESRII